MIQPVPDPERVVEEQYACENFQYGRQAKTAKEPVLWRARRNDALLDESGHEPAHGGHGDVSHHMSRSSLDAAPKRPHLLEDGDRGERQYNEGCPFHVGYNSPAPPLPFP